MKILIVDDNAKTKCLGIMQECKKRNIEVIVEKSINSALRNILLDGGHTIQGIVLDMGLPIEPNENNIEVNGGEEILKEMSRNGYEIPTLVFSETEMHSNYIQVFDKMKDWDVIEQQKKFFDFLQELKCREAKG